MMFVLVVEDDRDIAALLRFVLEDAGYQVCEASDGREALHLLAQVQPAVVLSDIVMPIMSGIELARAMRQDSALRSIKVVLMSAMQQPAPEVVYDAFIAKPFNVDHVLATLARLTAPETDASPNGTRSTALPSEGYLLS